MNSKNYSVVCYSESCNIQESLEELILRGNCKAYAYILHDKDIDSNGNIKKPHYHLYLSFINRQNDAILRKIFHTEIIETCLNPSGYLMYMTHYGTDKHQYAPNQIKSFNLDVEQYLANCICIGSTELDILKNIIFYINENNVNKISDVLNYVLEYGFFAVFKSNYAIIRDIIKEKNAN